MAYAHSNTPNQLIRLAAEAVDACLPFVRPQDLGL